VKGRSERAEVKRQNAKVKAAPRLVKGRSKKAEGKSEAARRLLLLPFAFLLLTFTK
jgi:hypothetical protein